MVVVPLPDFGAAAFTDAALSSWSEIGAVVALSQAASTRTAPPRTRSRLMIVSVKHPYAGVQSM
jgi:hypothetical protein